MSVSTYTSCIRGHSSCSYSYRASLTKGGQASSMRMSGPLDANATLGARNQRAFLPLLRQGGIYP